MSWTNLPADNTTDWSDADFLNQFVKAINERNLVLGGFFIDPHGFFSNTEVLIQPGDDVSTHQVVNRFQEVTENLGDNATGLDRGYVDPAKVDVSAVSRDMSEFDDWPWLLADWRAAAGLNANGFSRKLPDGNGGVETKYGRIQPGDYIGPWLFNELQSGIQVLTKLAADGDDLRRQPQRGDYGFGRSENSLSEAKSKAQAQYPDGDGPSADLVGYQLYHRRCKSIPEQGASIETYDVYEASVSDGGPFKIVFTFNKIGDGTEQLNKLPNVDIEAHGWLKQAYKSDIVPDEFDNHGTGLPNDAWGLYDSLTDAAPATNLGEFNGDTGWELKEVGSSGPPGNWPAAPNPPEPEDPKDEPTWPSSNCTDDSNSAGSSFEDYVTPSGGLGPQRIIVIVTPRFEYA